MALWRKKEAHRTPALVVGLERQGSLFFLRGRLREGERPYEVLGEAIIRADDSGHLLPLLAERLQWDRSEKIYVARETPLLIGAAMAFDLSRHEEGHAVIRDSRELLHRAQWRAADLARETAARYFGTTLEDLRSLGTLVQQKKESQDSIHLNLLSLCGPLEDAPWPPALPAEAHSVLLPLVLARRIGTGSATEALLHVEDHSSVFAVRRNDAFTHIRSLHVGVADILAHVAEALQCSERDAEALLSAGAARRLSPESEKTLQRILRRLLPMWTGMMDVMADGLSDAERPHRLLLSGLFPMFLGRLFCRRPSITHCMAHPYRVETLSHATDTRGISAMLQSMLESMLSVSASASPAVYVPRTSAVRV